MVRLRLKRMGRKKRPFYRIVAMDLNAAQGSQALGELGTYDPIHSQVEVDEESILQWLNKGAQMSETVHDLLKGRGILARWRGFEGVLHKDALLRDKPKRRRKLNTVPEAPAEEEAPETQAAPKSEQPEPTAVVEEAPEDGPVAEPAAAVESDAESDPPAADVSGEAEEAPEA